MVIDFILSNFEILIFISVILILIGFFLLFLMQNKQFQNYKVSITENAVSIINKNKEISDYLIGIGNLLEQHKNEIQNLSDKISFLEREINRFSEIKGSEDMLSIAIEMTRNGESRDDIKNKTNLRDDEIEAMSYLGYKTKIMRTSIDNIKITFNEDLTITKKLMSSK